MKRKKYVKITISILIFMIVYLNINTYAITPSFRYKAIRGTNIKYHIDLENLNVFQQREHITNAVKNWEHTGFGYNPIYMKRVSSTKGTGIDFYQYNNSSASKEGVLGYTSFFNRKIHEIEPDDENWLYAEVRLNIDLLGPRTYAQIQGTIAHEIGHAFGLAHYQTNPNGSIMCQTKYGRTVQTVQKEDNEAINAKYN